METIYILLFVLLSGTLMQAQLPATGLTPAKPENPTWQNTILTGGIIKMAMNAFETSRAESIVAMN